MVRVNLIAPKELHCQVDLGQIGVSIDIRAKIFIGIVPSAVQIIGHDIEPVNCLFDLDNVKVLHIPVRGWDGNGEAVCMPT
jgi:hypothetical protein